MRSPRVVIPEIAYVMGVFGRIILWCLAVWVLGMAIIVTLSELTSR